MVKRLTSGLFSVIASCERLLEVESVMPDNESDDSYYGCDSIKLEHIFSYDKVQKDVLHDFSFEIHKGECVDLNKHL